MRIARERLIILCGLLSIIIFISCVVTALLQIDACCADIKGTSKDESRYFSHNTTMGIPPDMEQNANNNEVISPSISYIKTNRADGIAVAFFSGMTEDYTYCDFLFKDVKSVFADIIRIGTVMIC